MKRHLQTTLLALSILLILGSFTVNADTAKTTTSQVKYGYYYLLDYLKEYYRFLPSPAPEGLHYHIRMTATANIDDTPEKETIVLMVVNSKEEWRAWSQAFLLITEPETEIDEFPKTKALFTLFGATTHDLNVPTKTIEVQSVPFVFWKPWWSGEDWSFQRVSFDLVDLTGDGILDIWVEHVEGVAVISFQEGEFVDVCSAYSSSKRENPIEYIDLDNDGIYEIKIPDVIHIKGAPGAAAPEWMSLYEWDGTTYVLNNERFYAENDKFLTWLLEQYIFWQPFSRNEEIYHFYIGLVYYYRGSTFMAKELLQRVARNAKNDDYRKAAETILKKLTRQ